MPFLVLSTVPPGYGKSELVDALLKLLLQGPAGSEQESLLVYFAGIAPFKESEEGVRDGDGRGGGLTGVAVKQAGCPVDVQRLDRGATGRGEPEGTTGMGCWDRGILYSPYTIPVSFHL